MKKILIIGNNNKGRKISDGGRIKIRLFSKLLLREGFDVEIADLCNWKLHIFHLISVIKKSIKQGVIILNMAGPRGCRPIIKMVNRFNKRKNSRVVFCPLGIGVLDSLLKNKTPDEVNKFISCKDFLDINDNKFAKELKKIDTIIVQNDVIAKAYSLFYNIDNVYVLENFRDQAIKEKTYDNSGNALNIIYYSRVSENKGIFDLINAVKELNKGNLYQVQLDIFGENQLVGDNANKFFELQDNKIVYRGEFNGDDAVSLLSKYDLFCLPTKYHGEGTSGSLIEAMIAGTPVLVSSYSQAFHLVNDGVTGYIFEIGNVESLINKLKNIIENKNVLERIGKNAQTMAKKYTFEFNKANFLYLIVGE